MKPRNVTVLLQRHPDGVVTVTFRQPEEADVCVAAVHGRWFAGQTLEAASWDGRTKYTVQESQEEMEKRLSKWHSFIEEDSTKAEDAKVKPEEQTVQTTTASDQVPDASDISSQSGSVHEDSALTKSSDDTDAV